MDENEMKDVQAEDLEQAVRPESLAKTTNPVQVADPVDSIYETHKLEHRFSVTDSWYELLAVIFMLVYVVTKTCFFIFDGGYTQGWMATVGFILDLILAVFAVCTFCAVVEVQEKADITNFNMGLMAKSLHDYYHDIADRLDELAGYGPYGEEETAGPEAGEEGKEQGKSKPRYYHKGYRNGNKKNGGNNGGKNSDSNNSNNSNNNGKNTDKGGSKNAGSSENKGNNNNNKAD